MQHMRDYLFMNNVNIILFPSALDKEFIEAIYAPESNIFISRFGDGEIVSANEFTRSLSTTDLESIREMQEIHSRALYNAEPTPFAFQGYDITTYTVEQIGKYGKGAHNAKKLDYSKMLQSNYNFTKAGETNGMINGATVNVIYNNDFTISTVE